MEKDSKLYCKNCESVLEGKYCNNCGQRASVNKVTFKETFQDFADMVFSVNAPLMLTIKMLVVSPGKLFREYLGGKRKTYYKPVPFFILTTILFVFIKVLLNYDPLEGVAISSDKLNLFNEASIFMAKNINNISFVFVFTYAIFLKLFFYKKKSLVEFVAISFYTIGFYILITTVFIFYLKYVDIDYKATPFILILLFSMYALTSLFKTRSITVLLKISLAYFISVIFYMAIGYSLSFLIVWLKSL